MELDNTLLCITTEAFNPVDVYFAISVIFLMVNLYMPVSTEHESVIASELTDVHDTTSPHFLNGEVQKRPGCDILKNFTPDNTISFKNAKYKYFILCYSSSIAFPSTSKVAFIHLNLTTEDVGSAQRVSYYSDTYCSNGFQHGWITEPNLVCYPPCRQLKLKEFDNPKPITTGNMYFVNPSACEIVELVSILFSSIAFISNPVYIKVMTYTAETTVVFPTQFCQKPSRSIFCSDNELKVF